MVNSGRCTIKCPFGPELGRRHRVSFIAPLSFFCPFLPPVPKTDLGAIEKARVLHELKSGMATADQLSGASTLPAVITPSPSPPRHRKFLMSAMQLSEKKEYATIITNLGGTLIESNNYDPSCTHIVVGQPSRGEKYLAGCAAGKWVLKKEFLDASAREMKFVNVSCSSRLFSCYHRIRAMCCFALTYHSMVH